jgi:hypothetical protein
MNFNLNFRSSAALAAIGGVVLIVLALLVVMAVLLQTGGTKAVSDNAALIGALVALGGSVNCPDVQYRLGNSACA